MQEQIYKVVVNDDGTFWYNSDDKLHRLNGPAIEWANGGKAWYIDGTLHRLDGPAIEWTNGNKEWWVNGKLHRLDGPAIEWADGYKAWWIDGVKYTEAEWKELTKPKATCENKIVMIDGMKYKLTPVD